MTFETADEDQVVGTGLPAPVDPVAAHRDPGSVRFAIPGQPGRFVRRSRLFEGLEHGVSGPLTLVSAPAGTGKTALVSAWATRVRDRGPVAWVTLEVRDECRECFWTSFARGLAGCGVVVPLPSQPMGAMDDADAAEADGGYVDAIVAGLLDRAELSNAEPVVMVLDCERAISAAAAEDLAWSCAGPTDGCDWWS